MLSRVVSCEVMTKIYKMITIIIMEASLLLLLSCPQFYHMNVHISAHKENIFDTFLFLMWVDGM